MTLFLILLLLVSATGIVASALAAARDGYRRAPRRVITPACCPNDSWAGV